MHLNWKWLGWQVAFPLLGPIAMSLVIVLLWRSGNPAFRMNMEVILDVSPWALTFYALTLIGSALNEKWDKLATHGVLVGALIVVALAVAVYASFIVIWRHDPRFVAGASVYFVTILLLLVSVALCHRSSQL
jgi:hypothetical protein